MRGEGRGGDERGREGMRGEERVFTNSSISPLLFIKYSITNLFIGLVA